MADWGRSVGGSFPSEDGDVWKRVGLALSICIGGFGQL